MSLAFTTRIWYGNFVPGACAASREKTDSTYRCGVAVVEQRELPLRLRRRLASDLDVLLGREHVEPRLDLRGRGQGGDGGNQGEGQEERAGDGASGPGEWPLHVCSHRQ